MITPGATVRPHLLPQSARARIEGDGRDRHLALHGQSAAIVVFSLRTPGNIKRAIIGESVGSLVTA
jgi:hypothetical protein